MIPLNDFKRQWSEIGPAAKESFARVGESGWYILGREVEDFETALAAYWGLRHAVGVASGLDAIQIGLDALGLKPGDRVLTTPLSAFATTLAILRLGGIPVFADVDAFGLIDLDRCEDILSRRGEIRFFVPVHLYGHALDVERLRTLARRHGCRILEDSAQCIGARSRGQATGTADGIAATSFYPTKNLGALGDGGALLCSDPELADRVRSLRNYGESGKYRHDFIGYNSRLDELQAALMAHVFLPALARWTESRSKVARAYLAGIKHPHIKVPGAPAHSESVWHLFPILVQPDRKAAFREHLRQNGVASAEHYPIAIPNQRAIVGVPHEIEGGIDGATQFCASQVSLPVHPFLQDSEVEQVLLAVNSWTG
jgi:dTDP-3-amino-3,4,6-trideoxy-alpha-D-glucose transaminase